MRMELEEKGYFGHHEQQNATQTVAEAQVQKTWWLRPGQKQHSQAAFRLGNRHFAAKDATKAIRWYERAAKAGHVRAQYNLGLIYLKGEDVAWDGLKGLEWIRKAAEGGDARAQALLRKLAPAHAARPGRAL